MLEKFTYEKVLEREEHNFKILRKENSAQAMANTKKWELTIFIFFKILI